MSFRIMVQYAAMRKNVKETAVDDTTEVNAKLVVESTLVATAELFSAFKVRPCRQWSIGITGSVPTGA